MKQKSASQSAFFNLRVLVGLCMTLAGVFLALLAFGVFSPASTAQAQQRHKIINVEGLPPGFDCARIRELGIDRQENFRAGAIMVACGEGGRGAAAYTFDSVNQVVNQAIEKVLAPLSYGGADVDVITGTETFSHVTQSETFTWANPDNPNQIIVNYNDSRTASSNYSGISYSSDGGATFTRLNPSPLSTGHGTNFGDPVVLYNRPSATWYAIDIATGCGSFGLGSWKSTDGGVTWATAACVHNNSNDDRESGWSDMNPSSSFYGRMYVSFNNFNIGGGALQVVRSTDNGATWSSAVTVASTFVRDVQITGDLVTGDVYIAGMSEGGGGLSGPRSNKIYRSTDGGVTWTNTYTSPTFSGPGQGLCSTNSYFATMFGTYWRHMGWGEPAAYNNVVHYVYAQHGAGTDYGDVYYIRSTDSGGTFSAPLKLNTDATTTRQWQPNLSVSPSGTLFAMWYDGRDGTGCTPGVNTPCYQMWGRKSVDNGATWQPDMAFSDVVSPLPAQPDGTVVACYAGDYDYASAIMTAHVSSWVDGRMIINNVSQQDAFFDKESNAPMAQDAFSRMVHDGAGTFDIPLPLSGSVGVECRNGPNFQMIVDFPTSVTVESVSVTSGTGNVDNFTVNGSQVTINLSGVTNAQTITVTLHNVNNGTSTGDVPVSMGVLNGDVNGNATVNASDVSLTKSQVGQPVDDSNFREDVNVSGTITATDVAIVKSDVGTSLPP